MTTTRPDSLSTKTILISGIHGFLGVNTAIAAQRSGASVWGIDLPGNASRGQKIYRSLGGGGISLKETSISTYKTWRNILEEIQPDIILHLAGSIRRNNTVQDWATSIEGNLLTTASMVQAILSLPENKRPIVIYPGSQMEYGKAPMPWTEETLCRPFNPYGSSKLAATDIFIAAIRAEIFKGCVARLAVLYGPAQAPTMFIPELIQSVLVGEDFKMTEGRQKRRFAYVGDAATLLLTLAARLLQGEEIPGLLNMPASEPKTIRDIAQLTVRCLGRPVSLEIGAITARQNEFVESWPDHSKAKELGFSCKTSIEDGLFRTVAWYRENQWFFERKNV